MLRALVSRFGALRAMPLYCSFDPARYQRWPVHKRFTSDFSYMGT